MPVENDVHRRTPPVTVAEAKPGAAPSKPAPARTKPGNANAPVKPLRAVPIAPPVRGTAEIEAGLRDIRDGKTIEGKTRIVKAIYGIVSREAGPKNWNDYDKAQPVTNNILVVYSGRQKDFPAVVEGVNDYLRDIVVAPLIPEQKESQFNRASDDVVKYVTDTGPNSRGPADRLNDVIKTMRSVQIGAKKIEAVKAKCEQAIAAKSK
jgi:hypothetical protein